MERRHRDRSGIAADRAAEARLTLRLVLVAAAVLAWMVLAIA